MQRSHSAGPLLVLGGVVAQAQQLGQLLPQQGNQRFPLAAGIGPKDGNRRLFGIPVRL